MDPRQGGREEQPVAGPIALASEQARSVDLGSRRNDPADADDEPGAAQAKRRAPGQLLDGPRAWALVAPLAAVSGRGQLRGVLLARELGDALGQRGWPRSPDEPPVPGLPGKPQR